MIEPLKPLHRARFGIDRSFCTTAHLPRVIKDEVARVADRLWAAYLEERFGVRSVADLSEDQKESLYTLMRSEIESHPK
jgi:hypothetical protein